MIFFLIFFSIIFPINLICFSYDRVIPNKELLKEVGVQAFTYAYKDLTEKKLGLSVSKQEVIPKGIDREIGELLQDPSVYFLALYHHDKLIGWATADTPKDGLLYGRFIAIHPDYCHQGVAQKLCLELLSIIRKDHCVKKITLMTRKKNSISCDFYKKHGFKESKYAHQGFNSEHFVGFEIDLDDLLKANKYPANS